MAEMTKMIEKFKNFWKWNRPIFMTRSKLFSLLTSAGVERVEWIQKWLKDNFEVKDDKN